MSLAKADASGKKTAFITGAASGIGKAIAVRLATREAYAVSIVDRSEQAIEAVVEEIRAQDGTVQGIVCDVTSDGSQTRAFQQHILKFSALDLCVLNAGIPEQGDIFDMQNSKWHTVLDVNLTGTLSGVRNAIHFMQQLKTGGTIVVTASDLGITKCDFAPAYAAAKAGLVHFVHSMADSLQQQYGIRLCALNPPKTCTPMVQSGWFAEKEDADPGIEIEKVVEAAMILLHEPDRAGHMVFLKRDGTLVRVEFPQSSWTKLQSL